MARIRSIKPEFPQSQSMGRVSRNARLLFIELWTLSDDEGRLRGNSRMLASVLFPYDDDAPFLIDEWIGELEREECIVRYQIGRDDYVQLCNWLIHQKIDKPSKSKIPPVSEASRILSNPREPSPLDQGSRIKDQGGDQGGGAAPGCPPSAAQPPAAALLAAEPPAPAAAAATAAAAAAAAEPAPAVPPSAQPPVPGSQVLTGSPGSPASTASGPGEPTGQVVAFIELNDGSRYEIRQSQLDEWAKVYTGVNVLQQLRHMLQWCRANPANRKTRRGASSFIVNWLNDEQNKAGRQASRRPQQDRGKASVTAQVSDFDRPKLNRPTDIPSYEGVDDVE